MGETSNERAQRCFEIWLDEGQRDDQKTAELCGVPRRTVSWYRATYGWIEQWRGMTQHEAGQVAAMGRIELRRATPLMIARLLDIIGGKTLLRDAKGTIVTDEAGEPLLVYASSDRDAVQAMKLMAQYSWGPPRDEVVGVIDADYAIPPLTRDPLPQDASPKALQARAIQILEERIESVNTRKKTGRRV